MVDFYFDFLSPYSYLASQLAQRDYPEIELVYRPVILGSMLARLGVKGPGEIPSRRRIGLQDALLLADHYGIPFEGTPTHPFNSIYALRSVCAAPADKRAELTSLYFQAGWAHGQSLEELAVLQACLRGAGVDQDPEEAATTPEFRAALKANTRDALAAGAWGVPTFVASGQVFFGHDRLPLLRAFLAGTAAYDPDHLERMLARPQPGRIV